MSTKLLLILLFTITLVWSDQPKVGSKTVIQANGGTSTNLTETATLTVGAAGTIGAITQGDTDGSNTRRIVPASAVTTDINQISAAAPIQGIHATDVSSTTNETDRASIPSDFRTASGTHASPTVTNPLSPTWTTPLMVVWYGATGTINLPAASTYAGAALLVYNTGAFTITIDPNGSEVVVRDGTVQTGGVSFTLSSGAGNYVFVYCDGTRWITLGFKGTLAQGS